MKRVLRSKQDIKQPRVLPFIERIKSRFNVRVDISHEQTLLATYERYWFLSNHLGAVAGEEKRFLSLLARKHNSFIYKYL